MSIESKLNYLFGTKNEIRSAIQEKGVSVPADTTFRQYADKIRAIETGSTMPPEIELNLQEKTANPTGAQFEVTPDASYDGLSKVVVTGEVNLKPENIAYGVTIYGVTGTMESKPIVGGLIPTAYQGYFDHARELYPGDYKNLMILESDQAVAFGFMLDGFEVNEYDEDNTEFRASKWVYVAYNKQTGVWKLEDWTSSISNGNSYIKNIRYSDTYIYYGTTVIYPYTVNPSHDMEFTDFEFEVTISSSDVGKNLRFAYAGSGTINWGDGSGDISLPIVQYQEDGYSGNGAEHAYDAAGIYTVHLSGVFSLFFASATSTIYINSRISKVLTPFPSSIINATGFFAKNTHLKSVPENLFEYSKNIRKLNAFFANSVIETIPSALFFTLFNLSNISEIFSNAKITSLPLGLFLNNPNITDVSKFAASSNLISIPNQLFSNCPKITTASNAFVSFKGVSLPETIFSSGISGINLYRMFYNASTLVAIESDFLSEVGSPANISQMFYNASMVTSNLPEFWEREEFVAATHSGCFYGCTKAANYADVPTGWK